LLPDTVAAGPVRMDVERHVVTVDATDITMPLKEFELLEMLLRNAGRVMTRGQLIDRVWGPGYVGDTKTLDVHIKRLRSKIEPDPTAPRYLNTVRGLGYKFEAYGYNIAGPPKWTTPQQENFSSYCCSTCSRLYGPCWS